MAWEYIVSYEELCDRLKNGTPEEKNEAELEIMGRLLYRDAL